MAKEPFIHYIAFHTNNTQVGFLKQLCKAKRPDGKKCLSEVLRDLIDWGYKPLMAKYFETPLSETQTEEPANG